MCFKKQVSLKPHAPKAHQLQVEEVYVQENSICGQPKELNSIDESFCLQMRTACISFFQDSLNISSHNQLSIKVEATPQKKSLPECKITYMCWHNIMPASVYKLVSQDPVLKKPAPSKLETGTYTTDTVKLVLVFFIWCIQIPNIYKKSHSM